MKLLRANIRESALAANGDCYEAAGRYMMDKCQFGGDCTGWVLVHGEVMGQGDIDGITFGHAWVESNGMVIDKSNGRDLQLPASLYYAVGKIDEIGNVVKYSWPDARDKILEFEHWGPWDLETSSGL